MLLGTNWALCPCGPSPWPFLKKDKKIFLSDVEWMGVLLHSTDEATLPTEIYPRVKVGSIQNSLSFVLKFHQLETVAAFLLLQCLTLSRESTAVRARAEDVFFREPFETKLKKKKGLLFHLLPWRISPHVKLRSKVNPLLVFRGASSKKNPAQSLPPNSEPALVGLKHGRHTNWLEADSCVNKAGSGYWKLPNLHKVCLREGRKGRL